jgi:heme oxygenase
MRLREATGGGHAALEAVMALSPLTLEGYGRALQVLHAVRAGWEPFLDRFFPALHRPHLARLTADLLVLRRPVLAAAPPPPATNQAEAWGVRYVLEGSALGGRMLLQQAATIGLTATHGASYFAGEGSETGRHWNQFLKELDAAATEANTPGIIIGAIGGFGALETFAQAVLA